MVKVYRGFHILCNLISIVVKNMPEIQRNQWVSVIVLCCSRLQFQSTLCSKSHLVSFWQSPHCIIMGCCFSSQSGRIVAVCLTSQAFGTFHCHHNFIIWCHVSGGLKKTQHMVEEERRARDQVGGNLTAAVDRVKDRLQSQMKDPEMLRRILEIALSYSALKLETSNQMANKCFISLTGEYLAWSNNFPAPFCKAVTSLATPKDLSRIDNFEHCPFDRNFLFNKEKEFHQV